MTLYREDACYRAIVDTLAMHIADTRYTAQDLYEAVRLAVYHLSRDWYMRRMNVLDRRVEDVVDRHWLRWIFVASYAAVVLAAFVVGLVVGRVS